MVPIREADLDEAMARLACGDRTAFEALYTALRPRAIRLAEMRVGTANAPDVAQMALLKVFARASEFSPGRPCLPWFYAIVANEIQATRRQSSRLVLDAGAGNYVVSDDTDAETKLVARELERALELAISALDDDAAGAISAMLGGGPTPNVRPATLRKRVSRAYAKLRLLLGGRDVG